MKYVIAVLGLLLASLVIAGEDGKTGLKIGEKAPEFKLKDQNGKTQSLSELIKDTNVALVFYRSASW